MKKIIKLQNDNLYYVIDEKNNVLDYGISTRTLRLRNDISTAVENVNGYEDITDGVKSIKMV